MIRRIFLALGRAIWARLDPIYRLDTEMRGDDLADQLIADQLDPFDRAGLLGRYAWDPRIADVAECRVDFADGRYLARIAANCVWRYYFESGYHDRRYWYSMHGVCSALADILGEPQEAEVTPC